MNLTLKLEEVGVTYEMLQNAGDVLEHWLWDKGFYLELDRSKGFMDIPDDISSYDIKYLANLIKRANADVAKR